uniref:Uncharacterized protein n=1 Tax=Glossina austeni TaxID=7395 RepID=A0A1A9ULC7_GLOAU
MAERTNGIRIVQDRLQKIVFSFKVSIRQWKQANNKLHIGLAIGKRILLFRIRLIHSSREVSERTNFVMPLRNLYLLLGIFAPLPQCTDVSMGIILIRAYDNIRKRISRHLPHVHMILPGPYVVNFQSKEHMSSFVINKRAVNVKSLNIFGSSNCLECNSTFPEYQLDTQSAEDYRYKFLVDLMHQ